MPAGLESLLDELEVATRQLEASGDPVDIARALAVRDNVLTRIPYPLPADESVLRRFSAIRDGGDRLRRNLEDARQEALAEWHRWEQIRLRLVLPSEPRMVDCKG